MSTGGGLPHRLSTDEVALVLHRAAELEAETTGTDPDQGFEASVIVDAAEEVGLSPYAVRQALAELRAGALPVLPETQGYVARLVGPSTVTESRVVACPPRQVLATADDFFRRRSFDLRRRQGLWMVYRERQDLWRYLRRVTDTLEGTRTLAGVETVTVTVSPMAEGECMVRVAAALQASRRGVVTMGTGYGLVAVTGLAAVATGEPTALLIGAPVGAVISARGLGRRRRWRRRRCDDISDGLAAFLDALE
jgi:hypothetical protein